MRNVTLSSRLVMVGFVGVLFLALVAGSAGCMYVAVSGVGPQRLDEYVVEKSPRFLELNKIALIDVEGVLTTGGGGFYGWFGTPVADIKEKLKRAEADGSVKAVVLRIDSPGGEVTAADILCNEVRGFSERTGKPVVAMFMGIATSGAYYMALPADRIYAHPTAVTGSIGVIIHYTNVEGLYEKLGLKPVTIKSGKKKDIASATRALTDEERQLLMGINRELFDKFMVKVRSNRPEMSAEDLAVIEDGRIVTAEQALALHMVDRVGYLPDALKEARELAGIPAAKVVMYSKIPHANRNVYASSERTSGVSNSLEVLERGLELLSRRRGPRFMYLWMPER